MSDHDLSHEQRVEDLASLRQDIAELKAANIAFEAQNELLSTFVAMMKTATGSLLLKAVLQQTLHIATKLTNARESSLFLINADGKVTESILARGAIVRDLKQSLIGQVLDKGLAGWVVRHRQAGLIVDTTSDNRWLQLPNQPYRVRSALCIPLLRGKLLLGVMTLMHSQPGYFTPESANLMQMAVDQMALVLENALLYSKSHSPKTERQPTEPPLESDSYKTNSLPNSAPPKPETLKTSREKLPSFGIYMMIAYGKFLYANSRLAEIFGYTLDELISLNSLFELVALDNCGLIVKQIEQCLHSQDKCLWCTFKGQRKDGSLIPIEIYGKTTKFYGKSVVIGILRTLES